MCRQRWLRWWRSRAWALRQRPRCCLPRTPAARSCRMRRSTPRWAAGGCACARVCVCVCVDGCGSSGEAAWPRQLWWRHVLPARPHQTPPREHGPCAHARHPRSYTAKEYLELLAACRAKAAALAQQDAGARVCRRRLLRQGEQPAVCVRKRTTRARRHACQRTRHHTPLTGTGWSAVLVERCLYAAELARKAAATGAAAGGGGRPSAGKRKAAAPAAAGGGKKPAASRKGAAAAGSGGGGGGAATGGGDSGQPQPAGARRQTGAADAETPKAKGGARH
jgi:hypothetical protein